MSNYSPINVRNPSSLCHSVKVFPGQDILLVLDKNDYPNSKIEISRHGASDLCLLDVAYVREDEFRVTYRISQTCDLESWSIYSSCFLGDVWIDSESSIARLLVVLESKSVEKAEHLTVINPSKQDIKLRPYQILELVFYDTSFGYNDEWTLEWKPKKKLCMECIGKDYLTLFGTRYSLPENLDNSDDPSYRYARCKRLDPDVTCRQHHFWFRFDSGVLDLLNDNDCLSVGSFDIVGYSNKFQKYNCSTVLCDVGVYVDLKPKFRGRVLHTLGVQKRDETNRTFVVPSSYTYHAPYRPPKRLPVLREVTIKKVEDDDIAKGCKVIDADPPKMVIMPGQPPWHNNQDFYFPGNRFAIGHPNILPTCDDWD